MKLPIKDIKIGERQRLDIGDLSDLDSMSDPEVGLVQPVVVHKLLDGYELVAGRRRLAKAVDLGWTEIEVVDKGTLSTIAKEKSELVEDIARKDRTWQEACLATAKLHRLIESERLAEGEKWTQRAMARFTGYSRTYVYYMLRIADALAVKPKDEEVWNADGYNEAFKILVAREAAATRAEQELRRQSDNIQEILKIDGNQEGNIQVIPKEFDIFEEGEGLVHFIDGTPVGLPKVIYICGYNIDFALAQPGKQFLAGRAQAVLAYRMRDALAVRNAVTALALDRYFLNVGVDDQSEGTMPWQLVWNKIKPTESTWPFSDNYEAITVYAKRDEGEAYPMVPEPVGSVFSVFQDDPDELPDGLVLALLNAICPPNMPVLLPCNAPVVACAAAGHTPIWFEPDKAKFDAKVAALKAFYEETVPGVEVRMQE